MDKRKKRLILTISILIVTVIALVGGIVAMKHQNEVSINDHTTGEATGIFEKEKEEENVVTIENKAALSSNVVMFSEEDEGKINEAILSIDTTETGYLAMVAEQGSRLDELAEGDIFWLSGDENSPFGMTYIGMISHISYDENGDKMFYLETPSIDEVFDSVSMDVKEKLTTDQISYIHTAEGVSYSYTNDSLKSLFAAEQPQVLHMSNNTEGFHGEDNLVFTVEMDLMKVLGLNENSTAANEGVGYIDAINTKVIKTKKGKCYHKDTCRYLRVVRDEISLTEAVDLGLKPCTVCKPPVLTDDDKQAKAELGLVLTGKVGFESIDAAVTYDWDIMNAGGIHNLIISADGNFVSGLTLEGSFEAKIGGKTTSVGKSDSKFSFEGLDEKLIPIAFVAYNSALTPVTVVLPSPTLEQAGIRAATQEIPVTLGVLLYADINGSIKAGISAGFEFGCEFHYKKTIIEKGVYVDRTDINDFNPHVDWGFNFEVTGDLDTHLGLGVELYLFNLNVLELNIGKFGFQAEGAFTADVSNDTIDAGEVVDLDLDFYGRLYYKLMELSVNLKAKLSVWDEKVEFNKELKYHWTWVDKTLFEFGAKSDTVYDSATMSFGNVYAKDEASVFFMDTNGVIQKVTDGFSKSLYDDSFYCICGIDESFLYLMKGASGSYQLVRVSKENGLEKELADGLYEVYDFDEYYIYYVYAFDKTVVYRMDRSTGQDEMFIDLVGKNIGYCHKMGDNFYVCTENNSFLSIFGGTNNECRLYNAAGELIANYGTNPKVTNLVLTEYKKYYTASRPVLYSHFRGTADAFYWVSKDLNSSVLTSCDGGWNYVEQGIVVKKRASEDTGYYYDLRLYQAENGEIKRIGGCNNAYAFFTVVETAYGDLFFFDTDQDGFVLNCINKYHTKQWEYAHFDRAEFGNVNLANCRMDIIDNTLYFYNMDQYGRTTMYYRYTLGN